MKHPFQLLLANKEGTLLFAAVQNHIIVYSTSTGEVKGHWFDDQQSPHKNNQLERRTGKHISSKTQIHNHIKCLALTESHLVASTDSDKSVLIFTIDHNSDNILTLSKRQPMPKRPYAITTYDGEAIVADKFGDAYTVPIDSNPPVLEKDLVPILGHVSMLTNVVMGVHNDKPFLITSDRDEHIRISNYPKSHVIKSFLHSHEEFVSQLCLIDDLLVSGGGDDYIFVWNWYQGNLLSKFDLKEAMTPFLTDAHFPPEKYRSENSPKEISVAKIECMQRGDAKYFVVLVEHTSCLVVLEYSKNQLKLHNIIQLDNPCVTFTVGGDSIYVSLEETILQCLSFPDGKVQTPVIEINSIPVDVDKAEFADLYPVATLRKRSEY
ncbi:TRM82 [Candida margitis]|uniref:TRM82 n=1 Tax=Candida margitis TaxID=1775924 RepID=UPI002226D0EB|nr:TRM82 [Candida margitis]KAI5970207.1 TRM82 [Candida margitis]